MNALISKQKSPQTDSALRPIPSEPATRRLSPVADPLHGQGNQATLRFAQSCPMNLPSASICPFGGVCHACPARVQTKLTINKPGDKYEQEADRIADQVMQMPEPTVRRQIEPEEEEEEALQTKPLVDQITPLIQRQTEPEEEEGEEIQTKREDEQCIQCQLEKEEKEEIQTKPAGQQSTQVRLSLQARIDSLKGRGQPLPRSIRNFFGRRLGRDFTGVHIHTDADAAQTTEAISAKAFTLGEDIAFASGEYSPNTGVGKKLIAHELTHVVQQSKDGLRVSHKLASSPAPVTTTVPMDKDRIARWEITGNTATVTNRSDRLWNLAKQITGQGRDWACIWPDSMISPKSWNDVYERYIQIGDKFDISNLTLTTGPSATFTFRGGDEYLRACLTLYGGTDPGMDLGLGIAHLANEGATPIKDLTVCGHTIGSQVSDHSSSYSPTGLNPERPAPTGIGAHNKRGPHRSWFTRNATVRFVGCSSQTLAESFSKAFLRKGAAALGTNHHVCGWRRPPWVSKLGARVPPRYFLSVEGPPCTWPPTAPGLHTAAAVNGYGGLWVRRDGKL